MKFILKREMPRECNHNHDCDNCTTHECSDTVLESEQVSKEEYVAALRKAIRNCDIEYEGDEVIGSYNEWLYTEKAEKQLSQIESGEYPDSTFTFTI